MSYKPSLPTRDAAKALHLCSDAPNGVTGGALHDAHGIPLSVLTGLVTLGLLRFVREPLVGGLVIIRFHLTPAGRSAMAGAWQYGWEHDELVVLP